MLYFVLFATLIFSSYFIPYFVLQPDPPSLAYLVFWTGVTLSSIFLAVFIMSKWREDQ